MKTFKCEECGHIDWDDGQHVCPTQQEIEETQRLIQEALDERERNRGVYERMINSH